MKKNIILVLMMILFFKPLLIVAQSQKKYSDYPLTVMGFDKYSTRQKVENALQEMGLEYEFYVPEPTNEFGEVLYNLYGGGSTRVYSIKWKNMFFEEMVFQYNSSNLLASIEMYPDINVSFVEAKKFFNDLTIDYPKRRTAFFHLGFTNDDRDLVSILIKNGADENESAVMSLNEPYVYEFFFHGDQLKSYSLMNSW